MPNKDGTGPFGQGPIAGREIGRQGKIGGMRSGPGGYCVCPKCGERNKIKRLSLTHDYFEPQ